MKSKLSPASWDLSKLVLSPTSQLLLPLSSILEHLGVGAASSSRLLTVSSTQEKTEPIQAYISRPKTYL